MKRLNGWQRIGVILSVVWIIGGWLWLFHLGTEEAIAPRANYRDMCSQAYQSSDAVDRYERYKKCTDKAETIPFLHTDQENVVAATVETFVILGLAWLFVYVLVWITRWVRTGFQQNASRP